MDWGNVTAEDLIDALREVDWSSPPRPVSEFFSRFTVPRSCSKWNSRAKCNLYYYRTNYFIMVVFILGIGFLRKPLAIVAAIFTGFTIAFLNDSFAVTFNEKVTRTVRQFSPPSSCKTEATNNTCYPWEVICQKSYSYMWPASLGVCPDIFSSQLHLVVHILQSSYCFMGTSNRSFSNTSTC